MVVSPGSSTITVTTLFDNPNQATGYVYVFAKSPTTGAAIKFDWLAGDSFQAAPDLFGGIDLPPVVFQGGAALAAGANTDVDSDGVRDLNGNEYSKVSEELIVPLEADVGALLELVEEAAGGRVGAR